MSTPRSMASLVLSAVLLVLGVSVSRCSGSMVEFHQLDVTSPSFDVDGGLSADERWMRVSAAAGVPLKGWNSYDGWDWSVAERDVVNNIDYLAANLTRYGYNIATIDYYWYMALDGSTVYIDQYGRVQPDPQRFPSAAPQQGFKKLAAYAHSKGLLFGIHTMRGINIVAVKNKSAVLGSDYTADEVYDRTNPCPWSPGYDAVSKFYSLNMSHPGGQLFYDSLYAQYAEWGVDFIKNDCVYSNFVVDQIDAVSVAIERSGRRMLYSLSPGQSTLETAARISNETNMYRVTGDTWDRWDNIYSHFQSAQDMQPFVGYPNGRYGLPSWPDLDMLPLGYIGIEGDNVNPLRLSNLTNDEVITLMSLWVIFRSPLMYGGDLQHPDPFSLSLLTNEEALAISDNSTNTDYVLSGPTLAVWRSDDREWHRSGVSYFTVHNIGDAALDGLTLSARQLRGKQSGGDCTLRDIWARKDIKSGSSFTFNLRPHQSGLYSLHSCSEVRQTHSKTTQPKSRGAQRGRVGVATD